MDIYIDATNTTITTIITWLLPSIAQNRVLYGPSRLFTTTTTTTTTNTCYYYYYYYYYYWQQSLVRSNNPSAVAHVIIE